MADQEQEEMKDYNVFHGPSAGQTVATTWGPVTFDKVGNAVVRAPVSHRHHLESLKWGLPAEKSKLPPVPKKIKVEKEEASAEGEDVDLGGFEEESDPASTDDAVKGDPGTPVKTKAPVKKKDK